MIETIKIPDGWHEVTVATFQELHNAEDNLIERMAILIDQDPEYIKKWDIGSINKVSGLLNWSNELPKQESWKRNIKLGDEEYEFNDKLSSLTGGQWLDIEHYLLDPIGNIHKLLAIFYSCEPELLKQAFVSDVYHALVFFSTIEKESLVNIQVYLLIQTEMMKLKNKNHSMRGLGGFTNWLREIQLKCLKSLN